MHEYHNAGSAEGKLNLVDLARAQLAPVQVRQKEATMIKGGVKAKEKPGAEGEEGAERQRQVAAVSDTLRPSRTVRVCVWGGSATPIHIR